MRIRLQDGTERSLADQLKHGAASPQAQIDRLAGMLDELLPVLWRMGMLSEDEVWRIVSGADMPEGASLVDKPERPQPPAF